ALGVRLLDRHSRGVRPTETGLELYERAQAVLALVEETERAIRPDTPGAGRVLRLGMPPAVARTIGVEAVLGAAAGFGEIALQVSEGWSADLIEKLRAGKLDFVVGYGVEASDGIEAIQLLEERFVLAGTPELIGPGRRIALNRALDLELIFYGDRSVAWRAVAEAAALAGRRPVQKRDVEAIDIWRTMLCRGVAAAIAPYGAIAEECRRGELAARVVYRPPLIRRLGLAGRSDAFAIGRTVGLVGFLADLIVSAHVALGPYYRVLAGAPKHGWDRGAGGPVRSGLDLAEGA
ncbi:MAG: LysR family transcriptional regulator, partial [Paracoccaceae bacterium]|nr:LysR family transcriptional regulator [Paracoccaceae bacterium]